MKLDIKKLLAVLPLACALTVSSCEESGVTGYTTEDVNCIDDLSGKRVAVVTGTLQELLLTKRGDVNLVHLNSTAEILVAVQKDRADYCIQDSTMFISSNSEENGIGLAFSTAEMCGDACVGFRKSDLELCGKFNEYLAAIKKDGTLSQMKRRWSEGNVRFADIPDDVIPTKESEDGPKPIIIGTTDSFPFSFIKNGEDCGFEVEMMYRFSQFSGIPIKFQTYEFGSLVASLVTGKVDVICSFIFITPERAEKVLFSNPYYHANTAVLGRMPHTGQGKSKSLINKVKAGVDDNLMTEKRYMLVANGFLETFKIAILSILFGTIFGSVCCRMLFSRRKIISGFIRVFHGFLSYIPFLVFLMILFYIVFVHGGITGEWVSIIAFTITFSLEEGTMFHSCIANVSKGQWEAGIALGFTKYRTFIHIILPQAMHNIMPSYKAGCIALIKGTSIVGYIAVHDLTKVGDIIRSRTFDAFFPLLIITAVYFLLAFLMGRLLDLAAKKF